MNGDSAEAGREVFGALFEDAVAEVVGVPPPPPPPPPLAEVGLCDRERKKAADCRKDSLPVFSSRADLDPLLAQN